MIDIVGDVDFGKHDDGEDDGEDDNDGLNGKAMKRNKSAGLQAQNGCSDVNDRGKGAVELSYAAIPSRR